MAPAEDSPYVHCPECGVEGVERLVVLQELQRVARGR